MDDESIGVATIVGEGDVSTHYSKESIWTPPHNHFKLNRFLCSSRGADRLCCPLVLKKWISVLLWMFVMWRTWQKKFVQVQEARDYNLHCEIIVMTTESGLCSGFPQWDSPVRRRLNTEASQSWLMLLLLTPEEVFPFNGVCYFFSVVNTVHNNTKEYRNSFFALIQIAWTYIALYLFFPLFLLFLFLLPSFFFLK